MAASCFALPQSGHLLSFLTKKKKKKGKLSRYLKSSRAEKIIALLPLPVKVSESNFILLDSWLFFSFLFPPFKWSSPPPLSHRGYCPCKSLFAHLPVQAHMSEV